MYVPFFVAAPQTARKRADCRCRSAESGILVPMADFGTLDYVDSSGGRWHRRGSPEGIPKKRLMRLLRDPEVRVVSIDGFPEVETEILLSEREAFWATAQAWEADDENVAFTALDYKNERGDRLVV